MVSDDDQRQIFREVYKKQGYIVIGYPRASGLVGIGTQINNVMGVGILKPLYLFEEATSEDWVKQNDLVAELRPKLTRMPDAAKGVFFKAHAQKRIVGGS